MHCKIIEIVPDLEEPLPKSEWARSDDLPESFVGEIADYTDDKEHPGYLSLNDKVITSGSGIKEGYAQ